MSDPVVAPAPFETFGALSVRRRQIEHAFTLRVPGLDVAVDREAALARLHESHRGVRAALKLGGRRFLTARQVHGTTVAVASGHEPLPDAPFPAADAIVTNRRDVALGIYVADCAPVWLYDPMGAAIGLVHSGKRGTELGVVPATLRAMSGQFGTLARDVIAVIGPCIRPPHYEVDFAATIRAQLAAAGVGHIHDGGTCTAADPDRYYSYRREKGRTGRMLALLALR